MHNETKLPPVWWLNPWRWVRFYEAAYRQTLSELHLANENRDDAKSELLEASEQIASLTKQRNDHKDWSDMFERRLGEHHNILKAIHIQAAKELGADPETIVAKTEELVASVIRVKQANEQRLKEELSKQATVLTHSGKPQVAWKKPKPSNPKVHSLGDLIELGKSRGIKNPEGWAKYVVASRKPRAKKKGGRK